MTTPDTPLPRSPLPTLQIVDVGMRFATDEGEVRALAGVSFDVQPAEVVAVIGPSGCGKTTLVNIIGGLLAGFDGNVLVDGVDTRARRGSIGMVFQEESTFPWRTTIENVAFPLEVAGVPRKQRLERARDLLALVGLDGFENRYPSELSGGMRQRTALARTLAFEPKVLLLDEPFAALDSQTRLLVGDKVMQIQQNLAQTMLIVTHNLSEAVLLADRVVILTYRPGSVKRIVAVDLARPRTSDVLESDRFGRLVAAIWHDLREEAGRGMSDVAANLAARGDVRYASVPEI